MSFADAKQEYMVALRQGKKQYRSCVDQNKSPYLDVLDEILANAPPVTTESLGLVSIPMQSIAGTKTGGRQNAFSAGWLPLLEPNTEFAIKWCNLYNAQMNEGIQEPIKAYEYMNRFYVQEGNKRVSVLTYCEAATIKAEVIRLIPPRDDTLENKIYYEFMDFYRLSKINYVYFTREHAFMQLQTAVCKGAQEPWTGEDKSNFFYFYTLFSREFQARGGDNLPLTVGDAILVYLSFYRYADALQQTQAQIGENLQKVWNEIEILSHSKTVQVSLEPSNPGKPATPLLQFFPRKPVRQEPLNVVFIQDRNPTVSAWATSHRLGQADLELAFPDQVVTRCVEDAECGLYDEVEIEAAARGGADVIFTTSAEMMPACLKVAARHPNVKILNCSLLQPHPLVRTYSCRIYEAKYLLGVLAGMLTRTSYVGYIANYPVYGVCAAINAFARGLQAVRPEAKVVLRWQYDNEGLPLDFSDREDINVFCGRDQRDPHPRSQAAYQYGLCRRNPDGTVEEVAYPVWHWGSIYKHIIQSILDGMWTADGGDAFRGVSYWWGMGSHAVELHYTTDTLPDACQHLLELLIERIRSCKYDPFDGRIVTNTGRLVKADNNTFSPEQMIHMNWLNENVLGHIPVQEDPPAELRGLLEQQGILPAQEPRL